MYLNSKTRVLFVNTLAYIRAAIVLPNPRNLNDGKICVRVPNEKLRDDLYRRERMCGDIYELV